PHTNPLAAPASSLQVRAHLSRGRGGRSRRNSAIGFTNPETTASHCLLSLRTLRFLRLMQAKEKLEEIAKPPALTNARSVRSGRRSPAERFDSRKAADPLRAGALQSHR